MQRRVIVTGSTGYIGSFLVAALSQRGWQVEELSRRSGTGPPGATPFRLGSPVDASVLRGAQGLIHCAYDFTLRRADDIRRVNVDGSVRLFESAAEAGVARCLLLSTMSAFEGCTSDYGRAKLEIERRTAAHGAAIIRPGLVWGGAPGGLIGTLTRAAASLPVVPLVAADRKVIYPAHIEDLSALVHAVLSGEVDHGTQPIIAAASTPVSLRQIILELARARSRQPRILPLPYGLVYPLLRGGELVGLRLPVRSDSLRSLVGLRPDQIMAGTATEAGRFRPFPVAATDPR